MQVLPFDEERFAEQSRGRDLIDPVFDPGGSFPSDPMMVERLMGDWMTALYDPLGCSLTLGVFRPTFEFGPPSRFPFRPNADESTCIMSQAWVRVDLID